MQTSVAGVAAVPADAAQPVKKRFRDRRVILAVTGITLVTLGVLGFVLFSTIHHRRALGAAAARNGNADKLENTQKTDSTASGPAVDTTHILLVDHSAQTNHFLFRTGLPKNKTAPVDINTLHNTFTERAKAAGLQFFASPADYRLVDINFLSYPIIDTANWKDEEAFFKKNPNQGDFVHWPLLGLSGVGGVLEEIGQTSIGDACEMNDVKNCARWTRQPNEMSPVDRTLLATSFNLWDKDQLDRRVTIVNKLLTNPSSTGKPLVIFGHCTCGCDRTGEFFLSYSMKFLGQSFTQAVQNAVSVMKRPMVYPNQVMAQWYCQYLVETEQVKYTDCGTCDAVINSRCSCLPSLKFPPESMFC